MSKDKSTKDAATEAAADNLAGQVTGLRVTAKSVEFDLEDKKKRIHTFVLEASAASMVAIVASAYVSGKKLHAIAKAVSGVGTSGIAELRFGSKPKQAKVKKPKPAKPATPKSPAEAASAPAEGKPAAA